MKLAVEVFGKGVQFEADTFQIDLTVGSLFEVFTNRDGSRGRRWFDWQSWSDGHLELWFGGQHFGMTWVPARARWQRANRAEVQSAEGLSGFVRLLRGVSNLAEPARAEAA
ncbi:hypothetical protein [Methylorubrum thiocyanatum]|uniref:hypothetical protein n=1 Tax=Methylorubrum thiocyanatum TaxID=47958 RepID=UPI0035C79A71